eukprot:1574698-Amphidinium_carterae.1
MQLNGLAQLSLSHCDLGEESQRTVWNDGERQGMSRSCQDKKSTQRNRTQRIYPRSDITNDQTSIFKSPDKV